MTVLNGITVLTNYIKLYFAVDYRDVALYLFKQNVRLQTLSLFILKKKTFT